MTQAPVKLVGFACVLPLSQCVARNPDRPTVSDPAEAPATDHLVDMPRGEPELIGHLLDREDLRFRFAEHHHRPLPGHEHRDPESDACMLKLWEKARDVRRTEAVESAESVEYTIDLYGHAAGLHRPIHRPFRWLGPLFMLLDQAARQGWRRRSLLALPAETGGAGQSG